MGTLICFLYLYQKHLFTCSQIHEHTTTNLKLKESWNMPDVLWEGIPLFWAASWLLLCFALGTKINPVFDDLMHRCGVSSFSLHFQHGRIYPGYAMLLKQIKGQEHVVYQTEKASEYIPVLQCVPSSGRTLTIAVQYKLKGVWSS